MEGKFDWSDVTNILLAIVLTLIGLQAIGLVFGKALGIDIYLGPVFILLAVAGCAALSIAILRKMMYGNEISSKDVYAVLVVAVVSVLLLFFLKDFVPEIFEQSLFQLQSLVMP